MKKKKIYARECLADKILTDKKHTSLILDAYLNFQDENKQIELRKYINYMLNTEKRLIHCSKYCSSNGNGAGPYIKINS